LRSRINGNEIPVKLATSAYKTGLIAGSNAAGSVQNYSGSAATFVTDIAGLEVAATGFTQAFCAREGLNAAAGKLKSRVLPDYMGGEDMVQIKVLLDSASGRFLGAQATGAGAASRINLVSMAIEFDVAAEDFMRTELAYCPAVSEVHDPLFKAVEFAMRRIRR
jgi:pyruvate/2-oxoglutarate dehydrogenase complex dihydrolipoamide dehydrogenase (E3) component